MTDKCPGSDMRKLTASIHKCPKCGAEVEMFSDEIKRRCPECKTVVSKKETPACVQWCASAKACLGEKRWKELMGEE